MLFTCYYVIKIKRIGIKITKMESFFGSLKQLQKNAHGWFLIRDHRYAALQ